MDEAPNWADLPNDLLHRIYTTLPPDLGDFVRFPTICKGWRNFDSLPEPPPQTPWLLECRYPARICPQPNFNFYSLASGQTSAIPALEQHHGTVYYGPGHGYLLVSCPEDPCLLNPLTGNKILLPKLNLDTLWIDSLVCSGLGPRHNWYIVSYRDLDKLAMAWTCIIYNQDKNSWTYVEVDIWDTSCSTCCFDGMLYATDDGYPTAVYDTISGAKLYQVPQPDDENSFQVESTHLVESSGDILRVCLYEEEGSNGITDCRFEVNKLCSEEGEAGGKRHFWVKVSDIGNQILFLDAMTGFSLKAPPGFNGNCIYFVSDIGSTPSRYNIGTGAVQEVPCPFDHCTWFIPSLD